MPEELPVACTLSAAELPVRKAQIAALGREALLDARVDGPRASLRFAAGAAVRERVERFAEAESRCCAFLSFEVKDGPDEVRLTIAAPPEAEAVLAELVAAFESEREVA
jgi:hypothetical protein